ncbi:MAG: type II toxin-antitoxin system Phd/YefM family antitoxin [Candidatus Schekmanbacteria bacterium]|nr:type II toxin-antitoxin system Phd/YefM family antitoxin [Candidatus Schekmanbacteria bacterium]
MIRKKISEARKDFADTLNQVAYQKERVVLYRRGKDVAAIVTVDDLALLEEIENRLDIEEARAALSEAKNQGTTSWETLKQTLGI